MQQNKGKQQDTRRAPMGPMRGMRPVEKAQDFKGTMKRLLTYLRPYRFRIMLAGFMAVTATFLSVLAPWLLCLISS